MGENKNRTFASISIRKYAPTAMPTTFNQCLRQRLPIRAQASITPETVVSSRIDPHTTVLKSSLLDVFVQSSAGSSPRSRTLSFFYVFFFFLVLVFMICLFYSKEKEDFHLILNEVSQHGRRWGIQGYHLHRPTGAAEKEACVSSTKYVRGMQRNSALERPRP